MAKAISAKSLPEATYRIEPVRLATPSAEIADVIAELSAESAKLSEALHPQTAASLVDLVRIMNAYYSNLIEGHNALPRDIARALAGSFDVDEGRRNLQVEAAAHVRVQEEVDRLARLGELPEPASAAFIRSLHKRFYQNSPPTMLHVRPNDVAYFMQPGRWRLRSSDDVAVGRHQPPSSVHVAEFMRYFEERYRFAGMGKAAQIMAMAGAHHRFNYIHPFPDGNGRVSRLMSHAMAQVAGIGAHGLWSVSRGLARGLDDPSEYKRMMDRADAPRESDTDGRGNLSERALDEFTLWFLRVCLDQVRFMTGLFELNALTRRLRVLVERSETLKPEVANLLEEAAVRGEFERGEITRITGLPERTARRVLNDAIAVGLLGSRTPKGPVSLRFTSDAAEVLFPRLFGAAVS